MVKNIVLILLIPALAFTACYGGGAKKALKREIESAAAVKGTVSSEVMLMASIEAKDFAEIFPRGPGKVIKRALEDGQPVKKGDTILLTQRDEVGYTFKPAPVVSTIDGYIGRVMVDVGASVDVNTPVASVVNPDRMRLKIDLPEIYLPDIEPGQKIDFTTDTLPGEKFTGEITSVSQAIDLKNRTGRIELVCDNPNHRLVHGMFAKLLLPVETHENAVMIPLSAVSWEADKQFVYKVIDGRIKRAEVKAGIRNSKNVEIVSGVEEGDVVAAGDLITLNDGEEVVTEQ
jgi:multidrug efflux pump subunit AcrA (membrane-fusion protein)